jgi:hypothetical protein
MGTSRSEIPARDEDQSAGQRAGHHGGGEQGWQGQLVRKSHRSAFDRRASFLPLNRIGSKGRSATYPDEKESGSVPAIRCGSVRSGSLSTWSRRPNVRGCTAQGAHHRTGGAGEAVVADRSWAVDPRRSACFTQSRSVFRLMPNHYPIRRQAAGPLAVARRYVRAPEQPSPCRRQR